MFKQAIELGSLKIGIGVILALSLFTINPTATFFAILFIPFAAKLLWRKNEPPILFFALMMQWSQICLKVFYADYLYKDFGDLFTYYQNIDKAYYYSLISLYVISIGIFMVTQKIPQLERADLKKQLENYNLKKIVTLYLGAVILTPFLIYFSHALPGLQQFFIKVQDLKWAIFFFFFTYYFLFDKNKKLFYTILTTEIIFSLTGYFSSFKDFFIIAIVLYVFVKRAYTYLNYALFGLLIVLLFNLMIVWQYVKPEYRKYLSGGESAQIVTVSKTEALEKLYDLTRNAEKLKYEDGITNLLDRLTYIDIFSASTSFVPLNRPHEHGRLWLDAFKRVLMPRILFPEKTVIDDTEKTITYTGVGFAGASSGTSVSLGYVTESYIDFGFPGMLVPLLLWGVIIGLCYKFILLKSYNKIWGFAFLVPFIFQINLFETALDKLVGSFFAFFLIYIFLNKFVIKRLDNYLKN
ncbi:hypothetical protein [Pedobacter aquatilis]|uniref:hypothetical protein n=1 Tax=Pedobacter aquatilis TaxID=351343 RepID=UPI00292DE152|nr:hypothetical protein [Pedobacter aquatilis]